MIDTHKERKCRMLLPPSMQDKTEFRPLGPAISKPTPAKPNPNREFERQCHDIPGTGATIYGRSVMAPSKQLVWPVITGFD